MAKRRAVRRNGVEWNEKRFFLQDPNTRKTDTGVPVDQCGVDLGKGFNPPLLRSGKREAGEAIGVEAENWPNKESESQNAREAVYMKSKRSVLGTSKKRPFQMKDADASRLDVIFPHCTV